jgi:hypothetical protein
MDKKKDKWTRITNLEAHAITGSASIPNVVSLYNRELPTQLQGLPGYTASFTQFYISSSISPEGIEKIGKLAIVRHDKGVAKSYLYIFGVKPHDGVYFTTGLVKDFEGHHFDPSDPIPIDKIFENLP